MSEATANRACRVCGGGGFIAQKQFIDDGYGEVESCPACEERDEVRAAWESLEAQVGVVLDSQARRCIRAEVERVQRLLRKQIDELTTDAALSSLEAVEKGIARLRVSVEAQAGTSSPERVSGIIAGFGGVFEFVGILKAALVAPRPVDAGSHGHNVTGPLRRHDASPGSQPQATTCPICASTNRGRVAGLWLCQACGNEWDDADLGTNEPRSE